MDWMKLAETRRYTPADVGKASETSNRSATAVDVFSMMAGEGFSRTWKDFLCSLFISILTSVLLVCSGKSILFQDCSTPAEHVRCWYQTTCDPKTLFRAFEKYTCLEQNKKRGKRNNK
jgi:hypothetical protein